MHPTVRIAILLVILTLGVRANIPVAPGFGGGSAGLAATVRLWGGCGCGCYRRSSANRIQEAAHVSNTGQLHSCLHMKSRKICSIHYN